MASRIVSTSCHCRSSIASAAMYCKNTALTVSSKVSQLAVSCFHCLKEQMASAYTYGGSLIAGGVALAKAHPIAAACGTIGIISLCALCSFAYYADDAQVAKS